MRPEDQEEFEASSFIESRLAYEGKIINLRLDTYQFDEEPKVAEIIEHSGAAAIIPIDSSGKIILARQWRRAAEEILLELPAGMLEKGEEPLACAKRELQEETGFGSDHITPLGGFYTAPGFCTEYIYLFVAQELYPAPLQADDDEVIELQLFSLDQIDELIEKNQITDAKTIAGIFRYHLFLQREGAK